MPCFGLIGFPLSHSLSKKYFEEKFKRDGLLSHSYNLYPINNIGMLSEIINSNQDLYGLNVTIPYKEKVMALLDYIDPDAINTGAVNVISIQRKNMQILLSGFNTDIYGFEKVIKPYFLPESRALILGTGGAAKASAYVFKKNGIQSFMVSRSRTDPGFMNYDQLKDIDLTGNSIVVNATPLGMYPETDLYPPFPFNKLDKGCIVFDWIYNPEGTLFLRKAREAGCTAMNGIEVFRLQADKSWDIWNEMSQNFH